MIIFIGCGKEKNLRPCIALGRQIAFLKQEMKGGGAE